MTSKVVVHSTFKRLVQVILVAVLIAGGLVGIKKFSVWWKDTPGRPASQARGEAAAAELSSSQSNLIVGRSSVIDADTLEIRGQRIRLEGVDAPESSQKCTIAGQDWACGQKAALALSGWLGQRTVSCAPTGQDRYKRTLARCFVDSEDVQAWLVLNGWALAYRQYSEDYVQAEQVAQAQRVGVWEGEFTPPWEWRRR
ncbi:thermonuclease family protein [Luteimonas granuli]|uniref:Thermonuclease family protein n=1 Tax=Luteimonas granuli TaxID=1176533 RepID=A0A518N149_9GAMM|nr:thermonuclease family protein [Luteimonas granuli]QDW65650.1 thermonuclease family protein [Luteimonas granuli]